MMHYALYESKCLLHHKARYARLMSTPNERLRQLREARYTTALEAAAAMGAKGPTYIQHENGTRGSGSIPRAAAERYAAFFRVSLDWLLSGKGESPPLAPAPVLMLPVTLPNADELTAMFRGLLESAGRPDLVDELSLQLAQRFPAALARSLGSQPPSGQVATKSLGAVPRPTAKDRHEHL